MARNRSPQSGIRNARIYNDAKVMGATLETANVTLNDDMDSIISKIKEMSGELNWFDAGSQGDLKTIGTTVATSQTKTRIYNADFLGDILLGNANTHQIGFIGGQVQYPTGVVALDASNTVGVVAATAVFGTNTVNTVAGINVLQPKNLVKIIDAATRNSLISATLGNEIMGLMVTTEVDGATIVDLSLELQFVEVNATGDGLVAAQASDLNGKTINYSYRQRVLEKDLPEDAYYAASFVDVLAIPTVDLGTAYANQVGDVVQANNININVADAKVWELFDSTGLNSILKVAPNVGNDALVASGDLFQVLSTSLDVNSTTIDFASGMLVGSAGANALDLGKTVAGTISSVGAMELGAGAGLRLNDGNRGASTWASAGIQLTASAAEWSALETTFGGETSLASMLTVAKNSSARTRYSAVTLSLITAGTNITGAGGTPNISAQLGDYSAVSFVNNVELYVDDTLRLGGATLTGNAEVAPGTNQATGDFICSFDLEHEAGEPVYMDMFVNG